MSLWCFISQVIKNPIVNHLPTGCLKIGTSYHAEELADVRKFAQDKPVVFVVGAMAHGKVILQDFDPVWLLIYCVLFLSMAALLLRWKLTMLNRKLPLVATPFQQP